jgi:hypothetical protein
MLPLIGLMQQTLQDPLLLRWHARWTRHILVTRLRTLRRVSARKLR